MTTEHNKIYLKKLISLASIASASVFLSLPALAETPNGCGSYRGNATTGGGWPCAMDRVNRTYPNGEASTRERQSNSDSDATNTMNRQSNTGASSSENGVTSNSRTNTMESPSINSGSSTIEQQSTTSQSTTIERRSTTPSYPATTVTPTPNREATMEQPQEPTTVTNTTTVNQSTDQGVRALW